MPVSKLIRKFNVRVAQDIAPYRNALVVNVCEVAAVVEGDHAAGPPIVAQRAIREARVRPEAVRTVSETVRLTVERYAAYPELEGERLIQGPEVPDLTPYHEVGA